MVTSNAIIIKKKPHREYDQMLELLTPDYGKITVAARGTRRINSKLNMHLSYLNTIVIGFIQGPKNKVLVSADTAWHFKSSDHEIYRAGFEIITLVDERVWAELPEPFTFDLVRETLYKLTTQPKYARINTIIFKTQFLKALGYFPNFTRCVACQRHIEKRRIFSFAHAGLLCNSCVFANDMIEIKDDALWGSLETIAQSGFNGAYTFAYDTEGTLNVFMDKLINYFAHKRFSAYEA